MNLLDALVVAHEHALWAALDGHGPCEVMRALGCIRTDLVRWQEVVEVLAMRALTLRDMLAGKPKILGARD